MNAEAITCLNGDYLPAARACVPVTDRGFRFGDGVFETIRLVRGVPYQWEAHLARMAAGLAALRITPPVVDWIEVARQVIARNTARDGFLRIAVSRGSGSIGYVPDGLTQPTWVMEHLAARPLPEYPYRLWLSPQSRAPQPYKLAQGVGSTLALLEARDHGCDEALQLAVDGTLCSAAAANLFWIVGSEVFTPPLESGCLAGTTRAALLRLAEGAIREQRADIAVLNGADGVFLTNCRFGLWPVTRIQPLGLNFSAEHPSLLRLQQVLSADIGHYYQSNKDTWNIYS